MTTKDERNCTNCHHFVKTGMEINAGDCCLNPPSVMMVGTPSGPAKISVFPSVSDKMQCGQWKRPLNVSLDN